MRESIINQIREQQAWEQPKKSSSVGLIAGAVAAFAAGLLLVSAFGGIPALSIKGLLASKQTATVISHNSDKPAVKIATGNRLGDASESKLLRTCMPSAMGPANMAGMDNKGLYNLLSATSSMMTIAAASGAQDTAAGAKAFSSMWAEVADCVFRQNGYALCEPDNRALAVEAVTNLVKQSAMAAPERNSEFNKTMATLSPGRRQAVEQAMYKVRGIRERVLSTLKTRAQEGRFISSDFGFFVPGEISQIMKETKATSDACAAKS